MKLLFVCDPLINEKGYNTALSAVIKALRTNLPSFGHSSILVTKSILAGIPPGTSAYPRVCEVLDGLEFDHIHIVTEGRLGLLARRYCVARGLRFTTEYHTQYPEALQMRHGMDPARAYAYLRWFHNRADRVIVPTETMERRIREHGIKNTIACGHGVNTDLFKPYGKGFLDHLPRPIFLYVGRLDPEKTLEDFLSLDLPGTKLVVGEGSVRGELEARFTDAVFVGLKLGEELAKYYAAADVFVFPSRTDTFGLVNLEAIASGTPVAAYPVTGPIDILTDPKVGCMDDDLRKACMKALTLSSSDCREFGLRHSWPEATRRFLELQVPFSKRMHSNNDAARIRFEVMFGRRLDELEQLVAEIENLQYGGVLPP
ncbi:MAG: glycosyltransferase family 1 protein [Oligoflexales bacterium]|nr:glycosyltransferase family 1 protein [Oligoflexales bacterium]